MSPKILITMGILLVILLFTAASHARITIDCDQVRIDTMKIRADYDKGHSFETTYIKYQGRDVYNAKMRYVTILVFQGYSDQVSMTEFGDMMRDLCLVSDYAK